MGLLPEPEDVDFVVEGGDTDPESIRETIEFVKALRQRPGHAAEVADAKRILESLGIESKAYGIDDPAALLEHWKRCVADLTEDHRNGDGVSSH